MADADLERIAADAPYIFIGTVEHAAASSVAGTPADEHTGIVRVEQVVRAPDAVGLVPGATVTVRSEDEVNPEEINPEDQLKWTITDYRVTQISDIPQPGLKKPGP